MRVRMSGSIIGLFMAASASAAAQSGAPSQVPSQDPVSQEAPVGQESAAPPAFTFTGDTALWTVAIRPDKTADFEQVMQRLQDALTASSDPQQQRQAEGWKVMRIADPLPDGNVAYVHLIHPVVSGADYTIMQILYDAFPDERQTLYELYRGAFVQNLSLAQGKVVVDMTAAPPPSSTPPATPTPASGANPQTPAEPTPAVPQGPDQQGASALPGTVSP